MLIVSVPGGYLKGPNEVTITRLPLVNLTATSSSTNTAKVQPIVSSGSNSVSNDQPFRSGYDKSQYNEARNPRGKALIFTLPFSTYTIVDSEHIDKE